MRLLFLLLFVSIHGVCQTPYAIHLDKSKGLPTNEIFDIYQDKKGYIWVASQEGLFKYDGIQFKPFTISNQYSKAGNQIREDYYGRLWYITFDGYLYYLKNDSLHQFNTTPGIGTYYHMTNKVLYFLRDDYVEIYDLKTLKLIPEGKKKFNLLVNGLTLDENIVLMLDSNLKVINEKGREVKSFNISPKLQPFSIPYDEKSFITIWDYDIVLMNKSTFLPIQKLYSSIEPITKMYFIGGKYFLVNLKSGLVVIDQNFQNKQNYFSDKRIACVMMDKEGKYWIGTLNDGIYLVSDFTHLVNNTEKMESSYSEIIGNSLFVGTLKGAVKVYDVKTLKETGSYVLQDRNQVYDFIDVDDSKGFYYQTGAMNTFVHEGNTITAAVSGCKEIVNLDQRYMMKAISGSIILYDKFPKDTNSKWNTIAAKYRVGRPSINIILSVRGKSVATNESKDKVYAVTNKGFYCIEPNGFREVKYQNQTLNLNKIIAYDNNYFLLSNDGSLLVMDSTEHFSIMASDLALQKIKKSDHFLILQSASNLFLLDLKNTANGIKKLSTNIPLDEIQQVEIRDNKLIYITGTGPLIQVIEQGNKIPLFEISSLNGQYYESDKEYIFPYNNNDMEIAFSVLDYLSPYSHQIRYRINNGEWKSMQTADRILKLASLQPGNYEIQFKVDQSIQKKTVQFTIQRPWYASYWFLGLMAIFASGAIYLFYKMKSKEERERNRLVIEKMELEYSLQRSLLSSIKSQMNPHFLFNALNTIQSFILTEDKQLASNYLSKFSKLTRKILEMSEREKVSLAEEKEALNLYLDLENMRFENLEYSIETDSELSLETVMIPSMIIQPYVENAIKHGLLHRKGNRILFIKMLKESQNRLKIIIDDNGIGRKRSAELNKIREDKHISFSTKANKKRLEILNNDNPDISVVYKDKIDESGQPAGTTVEITIPIN